MDNQNNSQNNNSNNNQDNRKRNNRFGWVICLVAALFILCVFSYMTKQLEAGSLRQITYGEFVGMLNQGRIDQIEVQPDKQRILITPSKSMTIAFNISSSCLFNLFYQFIILRRIQIILNRNKHYIRRCV